MSEFKVTGPGKYLTKDGTLATVAGVNMDADPGCRVVGWVNGRMVSWFENGSFCLEQEDYWDLVAVWTEPRKGEFWANVDPDRRPSFWATRESADEYAQKNRLACIHVQWTEGDGL